MLYLRWSSLQLAKIGSHAQSELSQCTSSISAQEARNDNTRPSSIGVSMPMLGITAAISKVTMVSNVYPAGHEGIVWCVEV